MYVTSQENATLPMNKHFVLTFIDVNFVECGHRKKWHQLLCKVHSKRYFMTSQAFSTGILRDLYKMKEYGHTVSLH